MMLSKKDIIDILKSPDNTVFKDADLIRKQFVGDGVHLRGLIEFSNICKRGCLYCGLQSSNKSVKRYRLSKSEILNIAKKGVDEGFKTIVLQSGEDDFFDTKLMCEIISGIKDLDVAVTLSLGEKTFEEYKAYKEAGADRYLLRIETTDVNLYEQMHPYADFQNRKRCLFDLKRLGFETGTGCLVGLPNQTLKSLADDIFFFKELDADMIGIGPFIPHPKTPLKDAACGDLNLAIKVMALTRIVLKDINIPATTAMETLAPNGRLLALQSGANVVMPNLTDDFHRKLYEIYPDKAITKRNDLESKLNSIGRYCI
ncbi:MAG TPA: [FeFe] hydrogenase H-cluster radical SAM maturase HydE [Candidatus Stercorousia faecigallinarum]|nr:[FeFe] hydrogenase H-cluster radical SAM maturase HydE [Candidatus Stercorousia faecigallinarum]